MSSTYTPSAAVDLSKEKDWQSALGMLDWDSTSIVFTKRSLIEFLKYTGTTVDTNLNNIAKLPRYAKFGKISEPVEDTGASADTSADGVQASTSNSSDGFKPTRRVREPPGGAHSNIFGGNDEDDDALARAPPKPEAQYIEPVKPPVQAQPEGEEEEQGLALPSTMKPSRRVREGPGGKDSLSDFWGTESADTTSGFRPTRRVRDAPGGRDNISGIF